MFIFYDLIFLITAIFFLPVYLFRGKFHKGFSARLGFLPKGLALDNPIWVHAVSVGEVKSVSCLLEDLRRAYPGKQIVISTVTPTGNRIAREFAKEKDFVTYLPLDFSFIVGRFIDRISPSLFILAETEIWPNLIMGLFRRGVPIITVNGRISDRSFRGYLAVKPLIKPILSKIRFFCAQTERDAERLKRLGVAEDNIQVTGNMKFDSLAEPGKKDREVFRSKLGLGPQEKLLVAGSTHPGEEEILLDVYRELLKEFPQLKLLIAPRHPERSQDIAKIISGLSFLSVFISSLPGKCPTCLTTTVFILDKVGELTDYYSAAEVVFVAGSLIKKGGHNILEPVSLGKPVLFGPYMFNFRDIADLFLINRAAIQTSDPEDLKINIAKLLNQPDEALGMVRRGQEIIRCHRGATLRNLQFIKKLLPPR